MRLLSPSQTRKSLIAPEFGYTKTPKIGQTGIETTWTTQYALYRTVYPIPARFPLIWHPQSQPLANWARLRQPADAAIAGLEGGKKCFMSQNDRAVGFPVPKHVLFSGVISHGLQCELGFQSGRVQTRRRQANL